MQKSRLNTIKKLREQVRLFQNMISRMNMKYSFEIFSYIDSLASLNPSRGGTFL